MKKIIIKGKTEEEAIESGLRILGVNKERADIKVLSEGKPGVFGVFGGEEASVEIKEKLSMSEDACGVLQEIINKLGYIAVSEVVSEEEGTVLLDVKGEDLGKIIGKEGAMLKSLQLIVSSIVSRDFERRARVYIDAGGYRNKQEQAISRLAEEAAKDVAETGQEKILPPMTAADRRIVHVALKNNDSVETFSSGEGADRRLTIAPKKK